MPMKDAAPFLSACIDSILDQTLKEWELVIVNDGSRDASCEIAGAYEDLDDRIRLFENKGEGIVNALSTAFDETSGTYITRMDADDLMPAHKLQTLYDAVNGTTKVVVTGRVKYFSDTGVSEGYERYENWLNSIIEEQTFKENLYRECVVASPNWIVHRSCFESHVELNKLSYPEDYDMVFQWIKHGFEIKGIPRTTHLWREHPDRTSRNSPNYQQQAFFRLKTIRFIEVFFEEIEGVQLIGKGDKGKLVAKVLRDKGVHFEWFDLQPGGEYKSVLDLQPKLSILSNWPKEEKTQSDIKRFVKSVGLEFGKNLWLF